MSLNFSNPMPHSNPALTSLASSLKRRSDPILRSLGPHPQRLCLRGCRRSALLFATVRSVNASLCGDRYALHDEHFNVIADLDVVELLEPDAAFEPGLDFAGVVLETPQRPDL